MFGWLKKSDKPSKPSLKGEVQALCSPTPSLYSNVITLEDLEEYICSTHPSFEALRKGMTEVFEGEAILLNWQMRLPSATPLNLLNTPQLFWKDFMWTPQGKIPFESPEWQLSLEEFIRVFRYKQDDLHTDLSKWIKPILEEEYFVPLSPTELDWVHGLHALIEKKHLEKRVPSNPFDAELPSKTSKLRL